MKVKYHICDNVAKWKGQLINLCGILPFLVGLLVLCWFTYSVDTYRVDTLDSVSDSSVVRAHYLEIIEGE